MDSPAATAAVHGKIGTMLVLSRKKNESIVINNDIVITVVDIHGDKVRLGIEAPKDVPVHRQEVYEAIHGVQVPAPGAAPAPPVTTASATKTDETNTAP